MLVRMKSATVSAGPIILDVKPGQWAALMLRIEGTTGAGAAPTAADFGFITFRRNSRPQASVSWTGLQAANNVDYGFPEATIGAAGGNPIAHSVILPATDRGDGNILDITSDENATVELSMSGYAAAEWGSGTVRLYGVPTEGVQMYQRQVFEQNMSVAANGTDILPILYDNISSLYVVTTTNVSELTVEIDGLTKVNADMAALQAVNNMYYRHEAAFVTGFKMEFAGSGALSEMLTDQLELTLRAGSGGTAAPQIITVCNDFTPDALSRSSAVVAAKTEVKFKRKANKGHSRPISVVRALTNAK